MRRPRRKTEAYPGYFLPQGCFFNSQVLICLPGSIPICLGDPAASDELGPMSSTPLGVTRRQDSSPVKQPLRPAKDPFQ